jgi:hypothetical protein
MMADSPQVIELEDVQMELQAMCRKLKLNDSQHRRKPFCCGEQQCTSYAPTEAKVGDKICCFPGSRIGLVFRQLVDRDDCWW